MKGDIMEFVHSSPDRAGFYRNPKAAMAEALAIKENAANGPKRPTESPEAARARVDKAALERKNKQNSSK